MDRQTDRLAHSVCNASLHCVAKNGRASMKKPHHSDELHQVLARSVDFSSSYTGAEGLKIRYRWAEDIYFNSANSDTVHIPGASFATCQASTELSFAILSDMKTVSC